jgi:hypothetical protein
MSGAEEIAAVFTKSKAEKFIFNGEGEALLSRRHLALVYRY